MNVFLQTIDLNKSYVSFMDICIILFLVILIIFEDKWVNKLSNLIKRYPLTNIILTGVCMTLISYINNLSDVKTILVVMASISTVYLISVR